MFRRICRIMALIIFAIVVCAIIYSADRKADNPTILKAVEQTLTVDGKKTIVYNIVQPDGTWGYTGTKGDVFNVLLKNETSVPISIHWHGLVVPNDQDGVPYVTQLPIEPGKSHRYFFKIKQAGTYWMHSHFRVHEQELMTAPLILKDANDKFDGKEVVVMIRDFTFRDPYKILDDLKNPKMPMDHSAHGEGSADLNDVNYNYFLANRRTLKNPEVYEVKPGEKVRLRLINAASASNFWIYTGKLKGTAIAVDGNDIHPIQNHAFQLAVAQRIDVIVTIPKSGGAFPILAQSQGTDKQTGVILATPGAKIPHLSQTAGKIAPALNNDQELKLHALNPLKEKPVQATLNYKLTGDMKDYVWKINDEVWPKIKPLKIKENNRVEMVFKNDSNMAHPMHFHGHIFQVTEVNGKKLVDGPLRDTILVLPHQTQKIVFDANNPGIWMMHCHVLYHMLAGMMSTTNYEDYPAPQYYEDLINGKIHDE